VGVAQSLPIISLGSDVEREIDDPAALPQRIHYGSRPRESLEAPHLLRRLPSAAEDLQSLGCGSVNRYPIV
jgi:hypothetical protein